MKAIKNIFNFIWIGFVVSIATAIILIGKIIVYIFYDCWRLKELVKPMKPEKWEPELRYEEYKKAK